MRSASLCFTISRMPDSPFEELFDATSAFSGRPGPRPDFFLGLPPPFARAYGAVLSRKPSGECALWCRCGGPATRAATATLGWCESKLGSRPRRAATRWRTGARSNEHEQRTRWWW